MEAKCELKLNIELFENSESLETNKQQKCQTKNLIYHSGKISPGRKLIESSPKKAIVPEINLGLIGVSQN